MAWRNYLTVGVTGGIGTGKTTVCDLFAKRNRVVISADEIARDLTEHDDRIRGEISGAFGSEIYRSDGSLNRRQLARIVFANPSRRNLLNSIVHPPTLARIQQHIEALPHVQRFPYILIEAALVFETVLHTLLDYTIVVDADQETSINRVMKRDGLSRGEIMARIKSQMSAETKRRRADFIIMNEFSLLHLNDRIEFLDNLLTEIAKGLR